MPMADYWWYDGWWLLWMLPVIIVMVFAIVVLRDRHRRMQNRLRRSTRAGTAQDILDRRYASGEISRQQYEEMKAALHH